MKPILFDSTLDLAKFASRFFIALNDQPKESIKNALATDTLNEIQTHSKLLYNSFLKEIQENLEDIIPSNIKGYLIDVERQFSEHEQSFSQVKELHFLLQEKEVMPATEVAWEKFHEILNNPSTSFTYQDKVHLYYYYCIASKISDICHLALGQVRRQRQYLIEGNDSKPSNKDFIDSWDRVLLGGFTLFKLKQILSVMPLSILDERGNLTEYSTPGNWAAVVAALRNEKKISMKNNATLYRLITSEFGKVASENQLKKGFESAKSEVVKKIFNSTLALAGI